MIQQIKQLKRGSISKSMESLDVPPEQLRSSGGGGGGYRPNVVYRRSRSPTSSITWANSGNLQRFAESGISGSLNSLCPTADRNRRSMTISEYQSTPRKPSIYREVQPRSKNITVKWYSAQGCSKENVITPLRDQSIKCALQSAAKQFEYDINLNDCDIFLETSLTPLPPTSKCDPLYGTKITVKEREPEKQPKKSESRNSAVGQLKHLPIPKTKARPRSKSPQSPAFRKCVSQTAVGNGTLPRMGTRFSIMNSPTMSKDRGERVNDILKRIYDELAPSIEDIDLPKSWHSIVKNYENLDPRCSKQQAAIFELIETESNYIMYLNVIIQVYRNPLKTAKDDYEILKEVDLAKSFSNVEAVLDANTAFWLTHIRPVLAHCDASGGPMRPSQLEPAFREFNRIFQAYEQFCIEERACALYIKKMDQTIPDFNLFLQYANNHTTKTREELDSLLVKPVQRLMKYKILLERIRDYTTEMTEIESLELMMHEVDKFVGKVELAMRRTQETMALKEAADAIDGYEVTDVSAMMTGSVTTADDIAGFLERHCRVKVMLDKLPELTPPIKLVFKAEFKVKEGQTKYNDVFLHLYTHMILMAKPSKRGGTKTLKVFKPPYCISKVVVRRLSDCPMSFLLLILNDFDLLSTAFVLTSEIPVEGFVDKIQTAKNEYAPPTRVDTTASTRHRYKHRQLTHIGPHLCRGGTGTASADDAAGLQAATAALLPPPTPQPQQLQLVSRNRVADSPIVRKRGVANRASAYSDQRPQTPPCMPVAAEPSPSPSPNPRPERRTVASMPPYTTIAPGHKSDFSPQSTAVLKRFSLNHHHNHSGGSPDTVFTGTTTVRHASNVSDSADNVSSTSSGFSSSNSLHRHSQSAASGSSQTNSVDSDVVVVGARLRPRLSHQHSPPIASTNIGRSMSDKASVILTEVSLRRCDSAPENNELLYKQLQQQQQQQQQSQQVTATHRSNRTGSLLTNSPLVAASSLLQREQEQAAVTPRSSGASSSSTLASSSHSDSELATAIAPLLPFEAMADADGGGRFESVPNEMLPAAEMSSPSLLPLHYRPPETDVLTFLHSDECDLPCSDV